MANFVLDPNIDADTVPIGEMDLCSVLLKTDARFPWVLLVPRLPNLTEFHDMSRGERALCMEEIAQVSEALEGVTGCDKINMAALGNIVSQLHIHIIARFTTDSAWPGPVWSATSAPEDYEPAAQKRLCEQIARALSIQPRQNVV